MHFPVSAEELLFFSFEKLNFVVLQAEIPYFLRFSENICLWRLSAPQANVFTKTLLFSSKKVRIFARKIF